MIDQVADRIMDKLRDFTDGVRVTMLIDRGVSNSNKGSRRWVNELISTNRDEFEDNLIKLLSLQLFLNDAGVRLYTGVNSRKLDKAIIAFQHNQLDVLPEDRWRFYSRINDRFCSSLMQPENRETRYFLLDYDSLDTRPLLEALAGNSVKSGITPRLKYRTPNGWHFICDPFNPTHIEGVPHCEIKKDGIILLNTLGHSYA